MAISRKKIHIKIMKKITSSAEFEELLKMDRVMMFFGGNFHGISKLNEARILEDYYYSILLCHLYQKKVDFTLGMMDVDEERNVEELYVSNNIRCIPTVIYYKKGVEIGREVGYMKEHIDFFKSDLAEKADDSDTA